MNKSLFILPALALLASCSMNVPSSSSGASYSGVSSTTSASSTSAQAPYSLDLKVAVPQGAPAVGFYRHLASNNLEINADASAVVGYMTQNSEKDIVVAPTNAGIMAIKNKNAPFKMAATLTFGNFYVAATGHDDDGVLDADDYVVLFQQNNVPDKLFHYCYSEITFSNLHYVTANSDAQQVLISGNNSTDNDAFADYVLIAEPAFTGAKSKNANITEYASIQAKFQEKSGGKPITQASIFVANNADKTKVDTFLNALNDDIGALLLDASVFEAATGNMDATALTAKLGVPGAMVVNLLNSGNRMGLGLVSARENVPAIESFMSLWGITQIDEAILY